MSYAVSIVSHSGVSGECYVHNGGGLVMGSSGAISCDSTSSVDIQGGSVDVEASLSFAGAVTESLTGGLIANFTYAQGAGHTVNFTDASYASGGGSIASWSWNFGDGSGTSTSQNPSYTYAAAGTYTVVLTATDGSSNTSTCTISVTTA